MSATFPALINAYPDEYDDPATFQDVSADTISLVSQYYALINNEQFADAAQLIADNPQLKNCIMTAATFQKMYDMNLSIQRFLKETWQQTFDDYMQEITGTKIIYSATEPTVVQGALWLKPVPEEDLA